MGAGWRDLLLDAAVDVGVRLLDPCVLRGLRCGEDVIRMLVHQSELRRPAARDLTLAFPDRPLPGGVDMCVADCGDSVRRVESNVAGSVLRRIANGELGLPQDERRLRRLA